MKNSLLDKILGQHLDNLDPNNLNILVQRLVRERSFFETIFNIIREGIMVIDTQGLVEYANQAILDILGMKEKEIGQAILWQYIPDFYHMFANDLIGQDIPPTITRETEISYPEKRYLRVYIVSFQVQDRLDKDKRLFALIFNDITQDKLSHESYVENEKIASIFMLAASVAHELGNPLNSIHIQLQLLERYLEHKNQKLDKLKHPIQVCMEEVQRLHNIIQHFLEAIRPAPPHLKPLLVLDVFQEVLTFTKQELENLNIAIQIPNDIPNPLILGDKDQLKQVFFNLLRNASEAMDSGGQITLTTRMDDSYLYLYLADTGKGIELHSINKVFEPYSSTKAGGHGLGMMIVQRIIRAHGGYIGVDSQEGTGTVVTLQFPLMEKRLKTLPKNL